MFSSMSMKVTISLLVLVLGRMKCQPMEPKVSEKDMKKCEEAQEKDKTVMNSYFPYYNKTTNEFDCYPILEKGPCSKGERIVLDGDRGIC